MTLVFSERPADLAIDLRERKIHSKSWTTQKGLQRKVNPFARGAFYTLPQDPIHLCQIYHREKAHLGDHEPIVSESSSLLPRHTSLAFQREVGSGTSSNAVSSRLASATPKRTRAATNRSTSCRSVCPLSSKAGH